MTDIEREPCPLCGEPAALIAQVCPHCHGKLLVDVVIEQPPAGGREGYLAARAIAALGAPAPGFAAAQQALGLPGAVLAMGVSRGMARSLAGLVAEHGGLARVGPGQSFPRPRVSGGRPWLWPAAVGLFLAVLLVLAWNRPVQDPGPTVLTSKQLAKQVIPSSVKIGCGHFLGSGFFVAQELVLTNAHVLCPVNQTGVVLASGQEMRGTVEHRDKVLDIALVRVPGAAALPLPLGDAMALRQGERVVFVGAPQGLGFNFHEATVSHAIRNFLGIAYVEIDGKVNLGNSGSPLLDLRGRVVGIVSLKVEEAESQGLALPVNYLFAGSSPLLQPPDPPADDQAWRLALAEVEAANRKEVELVQSKSFRPALVGVIMLEGRQPAAVVVRPSVSQGAEPAPEPLYFNFFKDGRVVCSLYSQASWIEKVGSPPPAKSPYLSWLKRNGLAEQLYKGHAPLDLASCLLEDLQGAELVLEGGDERADRVPFQF